MAREHRLHGSFELASLTFEVGAGAAFALGGVAWEFHPVAGEQLAADQALAVADEQDLGEDMGDVFAEARSRSRRWW